MYKIIFDDGSEFEGGEPQNSKWDELPYKPIKSLTCWITPDLKYHFENFEEYNHCVERVKGVNLALELVTKLIIMGRIKQRVYQVFFDIQNQMIYQLVTKWGEEYSSQLEYNQNGEFIGWKNGKSLSGWKQGIINPEISPRLKKI